MLPVVTVSRSDHTVIHSVPVPATSVHTPPRHAEWPEPCLVRLDKNIMYLNYFADDKDCIYYKYINIHNRLLADSLPRVKSGRSSSWTSE